MSSKKDCGCGKRGDPTRREFLRQTAVAGMGVAAALAFTLSASPASAAPATCEDLWKECCKEASQEPNPIARWLLFQECKAEYAACRAERAASQFTDAMMRAGGWIMDHGGAEIGTLVVIGGIVFIVVASGGTAAPVLVPAGALLL